MKWLPRSTVGWVVALGVLLIVAAVACMIAGNVRLIRVGLWRETATAAGDDPWVTPYRMWEVCVYRQSAVVRIRDRKMAPDTLALAATLGTKPGQSITPPLRSEAFWEISPPSDAAVVGSVGDAAYRLPYVAALLAGLVLVGAAPLTTILRRRARGRRGCCVACGYSVAGLAHGSACPECGGA